jgi:hypothetical protein
LGEAPQLHATRAAGEEVPLAHGAGQGACVPPHPTLHVTGHMDAASACAACAASHAPTRLKSAQSFPHWLPYLAATAASLSVQPEQPQQRHDVLLAAAVGTQRGRKGDWCATMPLCDLASRSSGIPLGGGVGGFGQHTLNPDAELRHAQWHSS